MRIRITVFAAVFFLAVNVFGQRSTADLNFFKDLVVVPVVKDSLFSNDFPPGTGTSVISVVEYGEDVIVGDNGFVVGTGGIIRCTRLSTGWTYRVLVAPPFWLRSLVVRGDSMYYTEYLGGKDFQLLRMSLLNGGKSPPEKIYEDQYQVNLFLAGGEVWLGTSRGFRCVTKTQPEIYGSGTPKGVMVSGDTTLAVSYGATVMVVGGRRVGLWTNDIINGFYWFSGGAFHRGYMYLGVPNFRYFDGVSNWVEPVVNPDSPLRYIGDLQQGGDSFVFFTTRDSGYVYVMKEQQYGLLWHKRTSIVTTWGDAVWLSALSAGQNSPLILRKVMVDIRTGVSEPPIQNATAPEGFALAQNYPNPFNPSTTISFTLPRTAQVSLKVFDLLGHEVAVLINGQEAAGDHKVVFVAPDGLSSGVYFYRLQAGEFVSTRKLVLTK